MGYENDLANLGLLSGGAEGFIKGMQDGEDRKMRRLEMEAKMKSLTQDRERQATLDKETLDRHRDDKSRKNRDTLIDLKTKGYVIPEGVDAETLDITRLEQDPKWIETQVRIAGAKAAASAAAAPPTVDQFNAGGFATRMEGAESKLQSLLKDGKFDPTSVKTEMNEMLPDFAERVRDPKVKQYVQAKRDFITAVLRKESGAAIGKDEYATESKKYFPQPGDTPGVLEAKRQSRAQALANLRAQGGRGYDKIKGASGGLVKPGLIGQQKGLIAAPKGKVKVSNGEETLLIDEKDLADAMKDGFKKAQ